MSFKTQELVVVTGTSSGIGRATAEQLAAEGFLVLAGFVVRKTPTKSDAKISSR